MKPMFGNEINRMELEAILDYKIKDIRLFEQAFTHRSLAMPSKAQNHYSYERMEFLGDHILGFAISAMLYKHFLYDDEGALSRRLTSLVRGETIADIVLKLGLNKYLQLSHGEDITGGRNNPSILADLGESLIAALWLDDHEYNGQAAFDFIHKYWQNRLEDELADLQDAKSRLQEWCMAKGYALPDYQLVERKGPDHAPIFKMSVSIDGFETKMASGQNRRQSEQKAAQFMLEEIKERGE